jgi:hypothetical protein
MNVSVSFKVIFFLNETRKFGIRSGAHCKEILFMYVLPEKKLRGLSPNFHIHVSVSDLYFPTIGPPTVFSCSRLGRPIAGILYINRSPKHKCRNWERGRAVSFLGIFVSNFRCSVLLCRSVYKTDGGGARVLQITGPLYFLVKGWIR